jgi:hypothetical protein
MPTSRPDMSRARCRGRWARSGCTPGLRGGWTVVVTWAGGPIATWSRVSDGSLRGFLARCRPDGPIAQLAGALAGRLRAHILRASGATRGMCARAASWSETLLGDRHSDRPSCGLIAIDEGAHRFRRQVLEALGQHALRRTDPGMNRCLLHRRLEEPGGLDASRPVRTLVLKIRAGRGWFPRARG